MPGLIVFLHEARLKQILAVASVALALVVLGAAGSLAAGKPSFADLVANLKSPTAKTRQEAASALGKSRRREAVAPLAALVRDPEVKVRLAVVHALRELRDLAAVPALVTSMQDGDPQIREEALGTLVEIYSEREASDPLGHFLETFSDEYDRASVPPYTNVDPSVYRALAAALADEQKGIREKAAFALGILDGRSEVRALVGALQDTEPNVRGAAATSIGKVGSGEDGKALIPLLGDESTAVRNRVLQALGVAKVREAGPALRELYEANRRKDFGLKVLACLSRIGDPAQGDLFRELLQDPDPERRRLAVEGLARVADTSQLAAFKKDYQRERNDDIKLSYNFAITLLGDHAFLDSLVLGLSSKTLGTRARNYLLELGTQFAPELYPYLNDQDAEIRAHLADLLAQLGNPDAIPHLMPLLSDPNTKVADRANRAVELLKQAPGRVGTAR
jgi:HEAT repeat protein